MIPMMQQISHRSRAYIWNSNGLQGFLVGDILQILRYEKKQGNLAAFLKYQYINFEGIDERLRRPNNYSEKAKLKFLK